MAINQTTKKMSIGDVKSKHSELEEKIFKGVCSNRYFEREMALPFAVLEHGAKKVVLAASPHVESRIYGNHLLRMELREIVSAALGGASVEVEVKKDDAAFLEAKKRIDLKLAKDEEEERILAEVEEQKREGRCNLIPFPVKENKVRSDLTVERHSLFAANTFKGDFRFHERTIRDPNTGMVSKLRIEIGDPTGRFRGAGVLKQKHQEAFYRLSQLWAKQNYKIAEDEQSKFFGKSDISVYDLVQLLRGNDAGRNYKDVLQLLDEMSIIRVKIEKTNCEDNTCDTQIFTLLSYTWETRGFNKETLRPKEGGESKVSIYFSELVTNNFLRKNIKTLMLDPYFKLKDQGRKGVSRLLYTLLDYELSTKEKFNISLVNLSDRLGLTQYEFKSKRKEKLKGSIDSVHGALFLDCKYKIDCHLVESEDGKDWVLIARRIQP